MTPCISNLLHLPVTRKEVLKRAKRHKQFGLCNAIFSALLDYDIKCDPRLIFPKFDIHNAVAFGARRDKYDYWWKHGVWNTGRMDFLDWLIREYKDDKANLRKFNYYNTLND